MEVGNLGKTYSLLNLAYVVDTVTASKFFPGPVSRIAGMPDTAPSGAVVSSLPRFLRSYRIMP